MSEHVKREKCPTCKRPLGPPCPECDGTGEVPTGTVDNGGQPTFRDCFVCIDAAMEEALRSRLLAAEERATRAEEALATHRHADEKHPLSQSPLEFVRSRNRKRSCDSDGFIGCERCQTMALCMDYESAEARAAAVAEERDAAREIVRECVPAMIESARHNRGCEFRVDLVERANAALAPKKGDPK